MLPARASFRVQCADGACCGFLPNCVRPPERGVVWHKYILYLYLYLWGPQCRVRSRASRSVLLRLVDVHALLTLSSGLSGLCSVDFGSGVWEVSKDARAQRRGRSLLLRAGLRSCAMC